MQLKFSENSGTSLKNTGYVFHAAITQLEGVLIKYFIQFVAFWKVLFDQLSKGFPDVGFNVLTEWGIKSYHFMQSIPIGVILRLFKLQ